MLGSHCAVSPDISRVFLLLHSRLLSELVHCVLYVIYLYCIHTFAAGWATATSSDASSVGLLSPETCSRPRTFVSAVHLMLKKALCRINL